jgi:hypothetical protein
MSSPVPAYVTRIDGPAPERDVARDLVKKGALLGPVLVLICGLIWGWAGAASAAFAVALVCVNFVVAAALITSTVRISVGVMMAAVLFGFLLRLGVICVAVFLVKDADWVELVPLGLTIIVTHVGLLFWELRYVSASLAFPGLQPSPANSPTTKDGR